MGEISTIHLDIASDSNSEHLFPPPLHRRRAILDSPETSQAGSDSSSVPLTDPVALDDEQKELFQRYCELRQQDRFLSLRDAELSEHLHLLSDVSEPAGLAGRFRTWMNRQEVNSLREARSSLSSQRTSCSGQLRQLKAEVRNSSGAEVVRKFQSMSQPQLEAFIEPKRRTAEIRLVELRAQRHQKMPFLVTDVVLNLSQRPLSRVEEHALNYGMHMSWPQFVDDQLVRVETEAMYSRLRRREKVVREAKIIVRALMHRVMRKWSLSFYKSVRKELEVLNKLAAAGNLNFCAACDGGPQIVILDRAAYSARMKDYLTRHPAMFRSMGPVFRSSGKCALVEQEERLNAQLEDMRCEQLLTRAHFYRLRCRGGLPPRLVGQADLRSDPVDPPLQPRILLEDSCMAALAAWLSEELRPLLSEESHVADASALCARLQSGALHDVFAASREQRPVAMLLHGVNPKLTLPLSATLRHIHRLIDAAPQTSLSSGTLERLTRLCCEKVLFLFEGEVYRLEDECVPFDNPLADLLVSFAFDLLDSKWRKSSKTPRPLFFVRSGPAALAIFKSGDQADAFLAFCNRVNPRIQQEMHAAANDQLTFLDLLVDLRPLPERAVRTAWPAKGLSGAAALRVPSVSFVPYEEKLDAMRADFDKCFRLNSCDKDWSRAVQQLRAAFKANGFPDGDIDRAMEQSALTREGTDGRKEVVWRLPFVPAIHLSLVRGVADVNRFLRKSKVVLELCLLRTSRVLPPLEPVPDFLCGQVVFSLTCARCGATSLHNSEHHLAEAARARQTRHRCEPGRSGPTGGEGEAEEERRPMQVPQLLLRSPNHKIARAVMEEAEAKERVRLHFREKRRRKTARV